MNGFGLGDMASKVTVNVESGTSDKPTVNDVFEDTDTTSQRFIKRFMYHSLNHSALYAFLGLLFPLFIAMIAFSVYPLAINASGGNWYPKSSIIAGLEDGLLVAEEATVFNPLRDPDAYAAQTLQTAFGYALAMYYWDEGGNVLSSASLTKIKTIEDTIYNNPGFSAVCMKNDAGVCLRPPSITQWAYPTAHPNCATAAINSGNGSIMEQATVEEMKSAINPGITINVNGGYYCEAGVGSDCATLSCPQFNDTFNSYVAKTWDPVAFSSYISRGTIRFGIPLEGFDSSNDRYDEQIAIIEDFIKTLVDFLESDESNSLFTLRFVSPVTASLHFEGLLFNDVMLVLASITMVWAYMWFHTKSLFLASFGMGHVVLSFPFAYFFLQLFLYPKSMGVLNFMSLFIILGIGADDVFILVDAWKQSEKEFPMPTLPARPVRGGLSGPEFRWLHKRLVWSYTRASWAMLVTSLTTSAAFFMNMVSSIPPIQIFGFFTAFMVLTNYFMVITYYPALIMYYEKWVKDRVCGAWHPCCEFDQSSGPCQTDKCCVCCTAREAKDGATAAEIEAARAAEAEGDVANIAEYRYLERKLYSDFAPWVVRRRWPIIGAGLTWFIVTLVFAAQLEPSDTPTQWVPDDDPLQQALWFENNDFIKSGVIGQLNVLNGVGKIDREGKNYFDADDIGNPTWKGLDLTLTSQTQLDYIENCATVRTWDHLLRTGDDVDIFCPMEDFRDYLQSQQPPLPFPADTTVVVRQLAEYAAWYEAENGPAPDYAKLDTSDSRIGRRESALFTKYQTIRFGKNNSDGTLNLKYLAIAVNTTLGVADSATTLEPKYDYFERKVDELSSSNGLGTASQTANAWVKMKLELVLLGSAYFGMGASLILAFVIIMLSTKDFVLTCMAVFTIFLIVVALIATIVWIGWSVSVLESICLTILVGLSVDYTIHLANSWRESDLKNREKRLKATLLEIGISVFSASITTFLACIPLFFCYVLFFKKFGIFIAMTIFWSTIYAFGFFCALLAVYGPTSGRNDFKYAYYKITCVENAAELATTNPVKVGPTEADGQEKSATNPTGDMKITHL